MLKKIQEIWNGASETSRQRVLGALITIGLIFILAGHYESGLPTGAATAANQTTANTSLSVIDDWDSSDHAKVSNRLGTFDDDDTASCKDLDTSSAQYTLPDATAMYTVCCWGNTAWMLGGSNPTAVADSIGDYSFVVADGQCHDLFFASAKVAYIAESAAGSCCFMQKDYQ